MAKPRKKKRVVTLPPSLEITPHVEACVEPVRETDEHGRIRHPICGHFEYEDRIKTDLPCPDCVKAIEKEYGGRQPHPICGCLKPVWSFRTDGGPCGRCLKDVEREYGLTPDPRKNDPLPTLEDVRKWREPRLLETDWVEQNPARVKREPPAFVEAIHEYRRKLFDITEGFNGVVEWPDQPTRNDYGTA